MDSPQKGKWLWFWMSMHVEANIFHMWFIGLMALWMLKMNYNTSVCLAVLLFVTTESQASNALWLSPTCHKKSTQGSDCFLSARMPQWRKQFPLSKWKLQISFFFFAKRSMLVCVLIRWVKVPWEAHIDAHTEWERKEEMENDSKRKI